MKKEILISVSPYVQKYYINETFTDLPEDIKETLRAKLAVIAEKAHAIITLGFNENGEIYLEYKYEDLSYADEIGVELRMKKFQQEEGELLKSIKVWYMIYHTPNGEIVRDVILMQKEGKDKAEVASALLAKYGEGYNDFINMLLEEE
ncbi:MAG: hypothetical protein J6F30_17660 [Cellulosilyticum sp.]|nr:hypothetical protein [Cellulosilyticum sp.]